MPLIRPITDLRNTNEISEMCHKSKEPIFITKNGYGDLVIMSIETYESQLTVVGAYKKLAEEGAHISVGMSLLECEELFNKLMSQQEDKYYRNT
ncbi:type II toxin-antitoxin system Phd/YefM family antitoxin [Clostridium sp.]|uniref:type II toxin-antitoxin system Phd/YefM family antitoxin n=1 Tax=Clostridium sp. TaxID=1506 RepID=UPI003D6D824D